ncbi:MAG: nucleotidyltransferase family protein [Cellvibrionaceae bacterium]
MNSLIENHRLDILALAKKNGVKNIRVFGSMAGDNVRPDSDVDLLVELEEGRSGLALGGFLMDVSDLLHRRVDVVTEKALHPRIHDQVIREARPL